MNKGKVNRYMDKGFMILGIFCTFAGLAVLAVFLAHIFYTGLSRIDWNFITNLPSRIPSRAGILPAWTGTVWIFALSALFAIPLGISAGIWLEEYGRKNAMSRMLEVNIANLAGVPSVIYGILGLELISRMMNLGGSLLAGGLTLALLILPVIIVATREAIRAVPPSIKEASFALGATKWQTIWHQVLPSSMTGIITGVILALSRAIGETAPLIVIGALAYVPFVAASPMDEFTVLPMQIFNWISRPQKGFVINAAAAIIILLVIVFLLNGIAIYLRNKATRKLQW